MRRVVIEIKQTYRPTACAECPHYSNSMDGIYCKEAEKRNGAWKGMIIKSSAEARRKIADKCPYLLEQLKKK